MCIRFGNIALVNEEFRRQCTVGVALKYRIKRLGLEIRYQIPELAYNLE